MQKFFINSFILLEAVVIVHCGQDYYQILGLEKSCKEQDVKKAFRKLALKYHPDKNKEEGAEAKFIEIAEAYEVLADAKMRGQYDLLGHAAFTGNQRHSGGNDGGGHSGSNYREKYNDEFFKKHHEEHMKRHQEAVQEALKRAQNPHNVHQETRTHTHTVHNNIDINQQHQEALKNAQNMHNNIHQQHQEALRQAQNFHKIHQQQQGAHFQKIPNIH